MVKKCREIAEIAVMEMPQVGVQASSRALAVSAATTAATASVTSRKRKANNQDLAMSTSYIRRRHVISMPENSVSVLQEVNSGKQTETEDRLSSPSLDHASASCCSSNGSSERIKFADLEDETVEVETSTSTYYSCRERETTPSSELQRPELSEDDELDSTSRPKEVNSRRRSPAEKMPTSLELEEFFAKAEGNLQKRFAEKYNYDIVKDEPLQGRYEWIQLKP